MREHHGRGRGGGALRRVRRVAGAGELQGQLTEGADVDGGHQGVFGVAAAVAGGGGGGEGERGQGGRGAEEVFFFEHVLDQALARVDLGVAQRLAGGGVVKVGGVEVVVGLGYRVCGRGKGVWCSVVHRAHMSMYRHGCDNASTTKMKGENRKTHARGGGAVLGGGREHAADDDAQVVGVDGGDGVEVPVQHRQLELAHAVCCSWGGVGRCGVIDGGC
jgi:hypothetical protein